MHICGGRAAQIHGYREKRRCRALNNLAQAQPLPLRCTGENIDYAFHSVRYIKLPFSRKRPDCFSLDNKFPVKRRRCKKRRLGFLFFLRWPLGCVTAAPHREKRARIISAFFAPLEWKNRVDSCVECFALLRRVPRQNHSL